MEGCIDNLEIFSCHILSQIFQNGLGLVLFQLIESLNAYFQVTNIKVAYTVFACFKLYMYRELSEVSEPVDF